MKNAAIAAFLLLFGGVGFGQFGEEKIIELKTGATKLLHGDIDGDGDEDLFAIFRYSQTPSIVWYENMDSNGGFKVKRVIPIDYPSGMDDAVLVDMDGDDDLDILAGQQYRIVWLENMDGSGNFENTHVIINQYNDHGTIVCDDVDNDGDMDVVAHKDQNTLFKEVYGSRT
jgi:VCBS repeat protein